MLLLDANLSPRLATLLADAIPGILHVRSIGLARASDEEILRHARRTGLLVVTKDADFCDGAVLMEAGPKVVWLRIGNSSTDETARLLRACATEILAFRDDPGSLILPLR